MSTSGSTRTTLISPFQYFADPTRARPIFNGFIFIGRVDGDPTNTADQIPVQVICECGGSPVNVTQPIRTGPGGLPIYNGSPAQIVVCRSNYSITLQDNNRVQVYHSPDVTSGFVNQPITHTTLAAAIADNNKNRMAVRLLERGGAEFRRAISQEEFNTYPTSARFTDQGSNLFVLDASGFVNALWLGFLTGSANKSTNDTVYGTIENNTIFNSLYFPQNPDFYYFGVSLFIRRSIEIFGDGSSSKLKLESSVQTGSGQFIGFRGASSSNLVYGASVHDLLLDCNDGVNDNCVGWSEARACNAYNLWMQNVGRKSITMQFNVFDNKAYNIHVIDSNTETPRQTLSVISIEGTQGQDNFVSNAMNNTVENVTVETTYYSLIVLTDAISNTVRNIKISDMSSQNTAGSVCILNRNCHLNLISDVWSDGSQDRFIRISSSDCTQNTIENITCRTITSGIANEGAIDITGSFNIINNITMSKMSAANQTFALRVRGTNNKIIDLRIPSSSTVSNFPLISIDSAADYTQIINPDINSDDSRAVNLGGIGSSIKGGVIYGENWDADSTMGRSAFIQLSNNYSSCTGVVVTGNHQRRIEVVNDVVGSVVSHCRLTGGSSASIIFAGNSKLSGVNTNNTGDNEPNDNMQILGNQHIWVDSNGILRINSGVPTADSDGVAVGSQT